MNQIRAIQNLSLRELESGILSPSASWHNEYKDQAYIYVGGLNKDLTEGDVLTIFSQYGVPVDVKLVRDQETGDSKGFGYLKYEDQRSTALAVDNLNGTTIAGKSLRVDHTFYTPRDVDRDYNEAVKTELERDLAGIPKLADTSELLITSTSRAGNEFEDPMAQHI
ncbi:LADA_0E13608g1_1 [Lachancea dasiensis]|uniref:LADA_0E13608g1_1 n=1 Tax=Lachancea dasiensis TaxID=1072105 RepID=A0A1G4JG73_9SACH|nr:LADA_0E13608g1_1 [Lachancea dasiensis]